MASFSTKFYFTTSEITKLVVRNLSGVDYTFTQSGVAQQIEGTAGDILTVTATVIDGYKIKSVVNGTVVDKTHFTIPLGIEVFSVNSAEDLPILATPSNVAINNNILTFDAVEHATSYTISANYRDIGTYTIPSVTSLKWKFNGKKVFMPAITYGNTFAIDHDVYNNDTLVESNMHYIDFNDNYTYMAFGSSGFWDTTNNQYGSGNIILFKTEPSGFLLQFLQEHCEALD